MESYSLRKWRFFILGFTFSLIFTFAFNSLFQFYPNGGKLESFFLDFKKNSLSLESSSFSIFQENTFYPVKLPYISFSKFSVLTEDKTIIEYIVKEGDTLSSIAQDFGIDVDTIVKANNLTSLNITPGQKLIILPVKGILHYVSEGETVSYLAKLYNIDPQEIIKVNNLDVEGKIYVGDLLIIPGAKERMDAVNLKKFAKALSSFFICPLGRSCRITQGLHWYNAVDMSNGICGEPVLAAAGGVVQKTGYSRIGGKYIRILHQNNIVTYYGHLSKIIVYPGQRVYQGQVIGYTGYTGFTIPKGPAGCHVHFGVRGAKNPFAK